MVASDPTYPLFPVLSFLGFLLSAIPLSWHFQAWNSGTCAFMIWTGVACLIMFINSIIWADNALNVAPVWCDISSQIILAASLGIPASTLCISRRLYRITSTQTVSITRDDKLRAVYVDLGIALGIPALMLVLHFVVQGHRFDIFEEYGCTTVTFSSIPTYFLYYMWPVAIGVVSLVYSSLVLRTFYMRRIQFNQVLSSNSTINPSKYFRLMLLAMIDIMCTIPIGTYTIYISLKSLPLNPWISWADTHFDFERVVLIPAVVWRSDPATYTSLQITRWLPIACAFVFFAIFGFAEEAMKNYKRAFWFFARRVGFYPASERLSNGKGGVLSGLKKLVLKSDDNECLPVYVFPVDTTKPSARREMRKSVLDAESRATICFPDDEYELSVHQTSSSQNSTPSSPSSTSTCYARTPASLTGAPPSYVDSTYLNAAALKLGKSENTLRSRPASLVSLPDIIIEGLDNHSRPSSYSCPSVLSQRGAEDYDEDQDHISISDAYIDSHPTSPVQPHHVPGRVPTPIPFIPLDVPMPPPAAALAPPPFSPPSVFPVTRPSMALNTNGIQVFVHTQLSREAL